MAAGIAGAGFAGLLELMDLLGDSIADELRQEPYASVMAEFSNSAAVFRLLGDPEKLKEIEDVFAEADVLVTRFFQRYPKEQLYVEGQKLRLLIGPVNGPKELSESEQLNYRNWFRTVSDPGRGRELRYPGAPWQLEATPAILSRPAPLLGEHNEEIFTSVGLTESDLRGMSENGVI